MGFHKTGSTSIQDALYKNVKALNDNGIEYFNFSHRNMDNRIGQPYNWVEQENVRTGDSYVKSLGLLTKKINSIKFNKVIFSSEALTWIFTKENVKQLKSALSDFDVKIICYIRRQDKMIVSHHQQGSKGHNKSFNYFGCDFDAIPKKHLPYDELLDYNNKICMWADIFGDENLIIKIFEKERLKNEDIVTDFFDLFGLKLNYPQVNRNESLGFEATKIGQHLNKAKFKGNLAQKIRSNLSCSGKSLPARAEAQSFYSGYISSNTQLNERFNISSNTDIFDNDFSMYPLSPRDKWEEESANQAISKILNITQPYSKISFDEIMEASKALKISHPELSLKLKKMHRELTTQ